MSRRQSGFGDSDPPPPRSWIVHFWSKIFELLGTISLYEVLCAAVKRKWPGVESDGSIEAFVAIFSLAAAVGLGFAYLAPDLPPVGVVFLLCLATWRPLEIAIVQINVLLFHEYRARLLKRPHSWAGPERSIILLAHNLFEVTCWGAVLQVYLVRADALQLVVGSAGLLEGFRQSLLVTFSLNAGSYRPLNDFATSVLLGQAIIGITLVVIGLSRLLRLLREPVSRGPAEKE